MDRAKTKPLKYSVLLIAMVICHSTSSLFAASSQTPQTEFDPTRAPTKAEWQHFHKMSTPQLTALWKFQDQRGFKKISDWSWQWRMGWIRRCEQVSMSNFCDNVLDTALSDEAMVVRAEAAHRMGNKYEKNHKANAIQALAKAYENPANFRNKHPLFVCDRILEALHKIGGKKAHDTAKKLAAKYPQTNSYWNSLVKIDANKIQKKSSAKL